MQIQGIRKELENFTKEYAPNFKTIEELFKTTGEDMHKLTDNELFRVIQHYHPEFKNEEDLTDKILEKMCKGEYDEPATD
ncbi:MAG TPA: hypothetical protein VFE71_05725 [Bacteroidales bacterium]|nr:hypothetical protein [Bacteroidales bacterium]